MIDEDVDLIVVLIAPLDPYRAGSRIIMDAADGGGRRRFINAAGGHLPTSEMLADTLTKVAIISRASTCSKRSWRACQRWRLFEA